MYFHVPTICLPGVIGYHQNRANAVRVVTGCTVAQLFFSLNLTLSWRPTGLATEDRSFCEHSEGFHFFRLTYTEHNVTPTLTIQKEMAGRVALIARSLR